MSLRDACGSPEASHATIGQGSGAARSVTVPVTLTAVANLPNHEQKVQHFRGTYTLQPEVASWRIAGALIAELADNVPVPADLAELLRARSDPTAPTSILIARAAKV